MNAQVLSSAEHDQIKFLDPALIAVIETEVENARIYIDDLTTEFDPYLFGLFRPKLEKTLSEFAASLTADLSDEWKNLSVGGSALLSAIILSVLQDLLVSPDIGRAKAIGKLIRERNVMRHQEHVFLCKAYNAFLEKAHNTHDS